MKNYITSILLSQFIFAAAFADDVSLGWCDGNFVNDGITGINAVAIRLPAQEFSMYSGSRITGIRLGLADDCSKGVEVFIRSKTDGEDIYTYKTGVLYEGWSDILFPESVDYPASDVVVGYKVTTGVRPGVSAVDGYSTSDACLVLAGNDWKDYTATGCSPACIQLIIAGDSYTKTDAALLTAADRIIGKSSPFELTGLIRNNTSEILTKARLSLDWGDGSIEADADVAGVLPGEIGLYSLPMDGIGEIGKYDAKVKIVSVGGKSDEYAFNDEALARLQVVSEVVERKVLIEEFTSQNCINCPTGKDILDNGIKGLDGIVMVAHHTGFLPDSFTVAGSTQLHYFYNSSGGSTYAPAVMYDRQPSAGNPGPVCPIGNDVRERVLARLNSPAEVAISLKRNYDAASRIVVIQVEMSHIDGMTIGENPTLSVYLLESGMEAFQSPNFDDYVHEHANRMFVTEVLGSPIDLNVDDTTLKTYTAKIDASWNADKMEIVAFVSNYDSSDPNNCGVYNAEKCSLVGSDKIDEAGVEDVKVVESEIIAIYTLSGARIDKLQPGINIVKYADGSVRKVMNKDN